MKLRVASNAGSLRSGDICQYNGSYFLRIQQHKHEDERWVTVLRLYDAQGNREFEVDGLSAEYEVELVGRLVTTLEIQS